MQFHSIPSVEDIPFDVSPALRSLLVEVLERQAALEERVAALEEENRQLREEVALERAHDRQRISKLEAPAPALREKTAEDHVNRLFSEMQRQRIKQTTTRDAARLLGVSKQQISILKPYLADDSRFVLLKDPHHKQRHLIRLV